MILGATVFTIYRPFAFVFKVGVKHIVLAVSYKAEKLEKEMKAQEQKVLVVTLYSKWVIGDIFNAFEFCTILYFNFQPC